jgi:CubicO group peptidase (beta-lactamase class C family)
MADRSGEWPEELSRLDRHGISGLSTPDVASLGELMQTYRVPGVSIAAGGLDGDAWCAGYGVTGAGRLDLVNSHTIFQACSISKHVAAFGALRLVADGVLDLDADIEDYLSSWRLPAGGQGWRPRVTLRQLLAHTAGLSYNWFRRDRGAIRRAHAHAGTGSGGDERQQLQPGVPAPAGGGNGTPRDGNTGSGRVADTAGDGWRRAVDHACRPGPD